MELYSYADIGHLLGVSISTVRKWKSAGKLQILGYRKMGKWKKNAVASEPQVQELIKRVLLPPDYFSKRRSRGKGK